MKAQFVSVSYTQFQERLMHVKLNDCFYQSLAPDIWMDPFEDKKIKEQEVEHQRSRDVTLEEPNLFLNALKHDLLHRNVSLSYRR